MKCGDVQRSLSAHLDDQLDGETRRRVSDHLERCAACAAFRRDLVNIDQRVAGLPRMDPGEGLSARLLFLVGDSTPKFPRNTLGHRLVEAVMAFFGRFFELLLGVPGTPRTNSLQEFGDFPPLSISHAYFQILNRV